VPPAVVGITREGLASRYTAADRAADRLATTVRQLEARSSQVSFKDLYTAVLALQSAHEDRCPACDTPLNSVTIDPYQKATAGLRDLLDLAVLQDEVADCREKTDDASRSLRANLDTLFSSMTLDEKNRTSVGRYIAALDQTPRSDRWWQDVYAPIRIDGAEAEPASLEQVLTVASRLELRDQEIQRQIQERQTIVQEREQLLQWQRQILERELIRKSMSMRSPRRESASRVSMRKMRT
jgi:hypothetical protein